MTCESARAEELERAISLRLRAVCRHMTDDDFATMVRRIAWVEQEGERRTERTERERFAPPRRA